MANCLGIYLCDNIVKYAKLSGDGKETKLESYGVRFVRDNPKETLCNIIEETNSQTTPIVLNPQNSKFLNYQMFDQVQSNKTISNDIARMEFEAWCERNAKSPDKYVYVHRVADLKNSENKYNSVLNFVEKSEIDKYSQIETYSVDNIYPSELLMNRIVPDNDDKYILVNLDDLLSIFVVIDGKVADIRFYEFGMRQLLADFSTKLGTYQKAYEACKQLNVYSEGENNNNKELESIAEPILQDVLKSVLVMVNKYKADINKVILTGTGIVFTNIDILFREYLGLKTEILKPDFIKMNDNIKNIAEVLETTQAIAIAYENLSQQKVGVGYLTPINKIKKGFNSLFAKKPKEPNAPKVKKVAKGDKGPKESKFKNLNIDIQEETATPIAVCVSIATCVVLVAYILFSSLYTSTVNKTLRTIDNSKTQIAGLKAQVSSDIQYVNMNMKKYKEINDNVSDIVQQIENNQIGKFTTYNVASFLQNIIRVIPKNVQLKTISSDDNKKIKITAQSDSYADLGYFVAELKLSSTLKNVQINKITNGETTVIEIGGDLP
ncbi:MAG: PilN domain-containing protein [Clostridia bacterium]|nr:PilN domain-containing protein [Clostridia bacterium]